MFLSAQALNIHLTLSFNSPQLIKGKEKETTKNILEQIKQTHSK